MDSVTVNKVTPSLIISGAVSLQILSGLGYW